MATCYHCPPSVMIGSATFADYTADVKHNQRIFKPNQMFLLNVSELFIH